MKSFLLLVVCLLFNQLALADATLVFAMPTGPDPERKVNYRLKNNMLRIDQADTEQFKLYDHSQQAFIHIDGKTGNISRIDNDYVNSRIDGLNQQRLEKVTEVESQLKDKLADKSAEEKRIAEDLINQLKYPEYYGAHTFLKVEKTRQTHTINKIKCLIYNITRKEQLLKQLCMASQDELQLSNTDYATLRGFYHFNYLVQTRLRIAMGKTDFIHVDYEQENMAGIPIEVLQISDENKKPEMFLYRINHEILDKALFNGQIPTK